MDNSNNEELTFEEAVEAMNKKNDGGNIDSPVQEPPKNDTFGMAF